MVVTPTFRGFTCDTRTGDVIGTLPLADHKWSMRLNAAGVLSASIPATSREVAGLDIRTSTSLLQRSFGVDYGGTILECGPILSRRYDASAGRLSITAAGLWSIFDRRKAIRGQDLHQDRQGSVTRSTLSLGPLSLGSIARELVRESIQNNPYGLGGLNIVLPPLVRGDHVRNYRGYDLRWIGEALRELTKAQDGPDIRFRPRYMGDDPSRVEWVMETGNPLLVQRGADWTWDGTRPLFGVIGFDTEEDGSEMAMRGWVPGQGQEVAMLLGEATDLKLGELGLPWTEVDVASKQEDSQDTLDQLARQGVRNASGPIQTFSITVRAEVFPQLGNYLPGEFASVVIPDNHPTLNKGRQRVRIMAVDGGGGHEVKVTLAPFVGTLAGGAEGDGGTVAPPPDYIYPGGNTYPGPDIYPA